ncbi:hypothetical protein ACHQM5_022081 [Ranunculus cassubicifolius]
MSRKGKVEILRKGVEDLVISPKTHGESSQGSSSHVNSRSGSKGGVAGEGASLWEKETLASYDHCLFENICKEQASDSQCPTCFKVHDPSHCPYFRHLPRGASFGPGCEIVCVCGNYFNEKGWFCTSCGRNWAALRYKKCFICNTWEDHTTDECSKDKARAAAFKIVKDELRSNVPKRILLPPPKTTYVPTSPAYVPTSPAYFSPSPWYPVSNDPTENLVLI